MKPRVLQQPPTNPNGVMDAVIVQDHRHVQVGRDAGVDRVEELTEFNGTMSLMELPDDSARFDFQGGEERGRAMTAIVARAALDLARAHPIKRLNAALSHPHARPELCLEAAGRVTQYCVPSSPRAGRPTA